METAKPMIPEIERDPRAQYMAFDQYQRYRLVSEVIVELCREAGLGWEDVKILHLGGVQGFLRAFIPDGAVIRAAAVTISNPRWSPWCLGLAAADAVLMLAARSWVDYAHVLQYSSIVFGTRHAVGGPNGENGAVIRAQGAEQRGHSVAVLVIGGWPTTQTPGGPKVSP